MNYNRGGYRSPMYSSNMCGRKASENKFSMQNGSSCRANAEKNSREYDTNNRLGMVYSPVQEWQNLYSSEKGFVEGTIFMELNKPFDGAKSNKGGSCLL